MNESPAVPTESGALSHPNVQRVRNYQAAMARGDRAAALTVFEPEVRYHVPGGNRLSGEYIGPDAVMGYFGKLMELTVGTYRISEMRWLASGENILLATRNEAQIGEKSLTWDEAILFEFHDGKKRRIELFQAEQAAVDAFFG